MTDNAPPSDLEPLTDAHRRATRRRRHALVGSAAAVIVAGSCSIAWAATDSPSGPKGNQAGTRYAAAAAHSSSGSSSAPSSTGAPTPPAGGPHGRPGKMTPMLDGTVTAVHGTSILIKDYAGFTRTIATSATTKFENGLTASPAVGTRIHAEGKVDANGTSLDATTVAKAPAHPAGPGHGPSGPGGFGGPGGPGGPGLGGGPGGHGPGGRAGSPGTGTASGSAAPSSTPSSTTTS